MDKKTRIGLCSFLVLMLHFSTIGAAEAFEGSAFIQGVRPMSMGGAFAAVADDENLLFFNPAGLCNIEESRLTLLGSTVSFNIDTIRMLNKMPPSSSKAEEWRSIETKTIKKLEKYEPLIRTSNPGLIHITYIRPGFAFALLNSDVNVELDFSQGGGESLALLTEQVDVLAMISYCKATASGLSIGGTVKGIGQQQIAGENIADLIEHTSEARATVGVTLSSDVGALYKIQHRLLPLTIGISAQNLIGVQLFHSKRKLKTLKKDENLPKEAPDRAFIFGIAYQPDWRFLSPYFPEALTFAADIGGLEPFLHLGAEIKALNWLSFRAGFHKGFSMGMGMKTQRLFLDVMYATKLEDPFLRDSTTNNFAISLMVRY